MNEIMLEIFPFTYFNCTFFTGICIFIKNHPNVLHKYLKTNYSLNSYICCPKICMHSHIIIFYSKKSTKTNTDFYEDLKSVCCIISLFGSLSEYLAQFLLLLFRSVAKQNPRRHQISGGVYFIDHLQATLQKRACYG